MAPLTPFYTRDNCAFACPLEWGVSVFWRSPVSDAPWFDELCAALEPDGIRVLDHRFVKPGVSQFAVSTKSDVSPLLGVNKRDRSN